MLVQGLYNPRSSEGLASSLNQVFGHIRSFKGWIQTEANVMPISKKTETEKKGKKAKIFFFCVTSVPIKQKIMCSIKAK